MQIVAMLLISASRSWRCLSLATVAGIVSIQLLTFLELTEAVEGHVDADAAFVLLNGRGYGLCFWLRVWRCSLKCIEVKN